MVTRRTLLVYNFGIGLMFVVVGALTLAVFEPFLSRPTVVPPFDAASQTAIKTETDIERLRAQAAFYFGLGRDLKRARYSDSDTLVRDFRFLCFLLGVIFAVGGVMSLDAMRTGPKK